MQNLKLAVILAASLFTMATAQAQSFLTNGLIAYYPFSGNAKDASGNEHDGTAYFTTITSNRFGNPNSAYFFNGTNAYVNIGAGLNINQFTVSAWIMFNQLSPNQVTIVSKTHNVPSYYYQNFEIRVQPDNTIGAHIANGSWWNSFQTSRTLNTQTWYHVAMTYDGASGKIFINGVADGNKYQGGYSLSDVWLAIGARPDNGTGQPSGFFSGSIDDVRIYNRALSSSEVFQLFAIETGVSIMNIRKSVYLDNIGLAVGSNYQLQVSSDLQNWTNQGVAFTATNTYWRSTNYWDIDNWGQLFFRLKPQ